MPEMKHYMDIPRVGHKTTTDYFVNVTSKRLPIQIMLKLDGANAQFNVNEKGELTVYSRNNPLTEENNLRGFYQYVMSKVDPTLLPPHYKIFGEWLVSHTVVYPQEMYNHFYIFDVFDVQKNTYLSPNSNEYKNIVQYLTKHCGMKEAGVLYEGLYQGMDHIESILRKVARSEVEYTGQKPLTLEDVFHEGIVIKCHDYRDQYGHQLFVKIVSQRFSEVKKVKIKENTPKVPDTSTEGQIAEFAATRARVEKIMNKLVDQGILQEDFDMEDMQTIAKNVPRMVFEDIMKEELETIKEQFGDFDDKVIGKKINSKVLNFAKDIIKERVEARIKNL